MQKKTLREVAAAAVMMMLMMRECLSQGRDFGVVASIQTQMMPNENEGKGGVG